jgi:hypothetical protein
LHSIGTNPEAITKPNVADWAVPSQTFFSILIGFFENSDENLEIYRAKKTESMLMDTQCRILGENA